MKLRLVSRVVVYNEEKNKIILVRNKGKNYWYSAGGGWEFENEKVEVGAKEVLEEIGLKIKAIPFPNNFQTYSLKFSMLGNFKNQKIKSI